ncbi:hypothetical protein P9112_003433 [Eukaryota sp. TZLM1-RC]
MIIRCPKTGDEFDVTDDLLQYSETLKNLSKTQSETTLTDIKSPYFCKCMYYAQHLSDVKQKEAAGRHVSMSSRLEFDDKFTNVGMFELAETILAAEKLKFQEVVDLCAQRFADQLSVMTIEEVRDFFGEEDDLTPAQKVEIDEELKKLELG